jgi:hypothetical protein
MNDRYILDASGDPVPAPDLEAWLNWCQQNSATLAMTHLFRATVSVSTVFLGVDLRVFGKGEPILWETMVFGGPCDLYRRRYCSRADAIKGHDETVRMCKLQRPITFYSHEP